MSNAMVMNQNYIYSDGVVSETHSSSTAAAPSTNVYANVRRSKVWRTAGYWNITSSINKVVFRDAGGADLTATIAVAEYTSDTALFAAIKTAMQAVGAQTYTISRDATTNKIKIASNGATFKLMLSSVNFTSKTTLGFTTGTDLTGAVTYTADTLKIHTEEFLVWDLGISSNPKAFILVGLRNTPIKISSTATVKLQGNATNVWTSPSFEQTLTVDDEAIAYSSSTGFGAYRYWRLHIQDVSNSYGYVEVSNVYLGDMIEPDQGAIQFPFDSPLVDYGKNYESEMGVVFSTVRQQSQRYNIDWNNLSTSEIETISDFIKDFGIAYPFFISIDPNTAFSSASNRWIKYVRFDAMPQLSLIAPNLWASKWSLKDEL